MKKMCIFSLALMALNSVLGQDSNDSLTFESYNLTPESFYNGSDGAGQIPFNTITLSNYYNSSWNSWTGFSISNITDNTTPGYANQYASFSGAGSNSSQYAVFYPNGEITFNQPFVVKQLDINNTAFAGISMRDGDDYGKKFGSAMNANGDIDGTNGEDFFILHIIPKDENNALIGDTIDFYLADFRFADSTQDYIIDTWTTIEFLNGDVPLVANKLEFAFSSSDVGDFGINTPTYFALDNLVVDPLVGIAESELNLSVFPNPFDDQLHIKIDLPGDLIITNQLGQPIYENIISTNQCVDLSSLESGVYYLTLSNAQGKSTSKIVKN